MASTKRINDSDYSQYFKLGFPGGSETPKKSKKNIVFQILEKTKNSVKEEPKKTQRLLNSNFGLEKIKKFDKVKHASLDFKKHHITPFPPDMVKKSNPLFKKTKFQKKNKEKIKKYLVPNEQFSRFKTAGNFFDGDRKYFQGIKKAKKINIFSQKNQQKFDQNNKNILYPKRYSYSPLKQNFEIFGKKNSIKRVVIKKVQRESRDSLGSAKTNVWSSNSPKSGNPRISVQNDLYERPLNISRRPKSQSLQENFFKNFFEKNRVLGDTRISGGRETFRTIKESRISPEKELKIFRSKRHFRTFSQPQILKNHHNPAQLQNLSEKSRCNSINSVQSCTSLRRVKKLSKVANSLKDLNYNSHLLKKKNYVNRREESKERFHSLNYITPTYNNNEYTGFESRNMNRIFRRIKNLTDEISRKNENSQKIQKIEKNENFGNLVNLKKNSLNSKSKRKNPQHYYYSKKGPKNEYFTTPVKKKKGKGGSKEEKKIKNYRESFMKNWQEMRSKGKNLTESHTKEEKIQKIILDKNGRKRLFSSRREISEKKNKPFREIMGGIQDLIFLMDFHTDRALLF